MLMFFVQLLHKTSITKVITFWVPLYGKCKIKQTRSDVVMDLCEFIGQLMTSLYQKSKLDCYCIIFVDTVLKI